MSTKNIEKRRDRRRRARIKLEDSYIKKILRKKGFMARDCTFEIIEETRKSIKALRRKKKLTKRLLTEGKYKCSRCFTIKSLDMFYKDSSNKYGHQRCCKECSSVDKVKIKASKKYKKRITENLEDVYIKRVLHGEGIKLEDVTSEMITSKRRSIEKHRHIQTQRTNFKDKLIKEDKRICRMCNKAKKNKTFIKKSIYVNVCLDCYKPIAEASKENKRIRKREYLIENADRIKERRKLWALNNPEIIKKHKERRNKKRRIKRREEFLIAINTCNDCNIELGLKKDTKGIRVCDDCEVIRKQTRNEENKERIKNYTEEQKTELKEKSKKYHKKLIDNLEDVYIRRLLCGSNGILKLEDIPQELVNAKREFIKIRRQLIKKEL